VGAANTLPYPPPVTAATNSQVILGNFTHQFGATPPERDQWFTAVALHQPHKLGNNAANRSTVG